MAVESEGAGVVGVGREVAAAAAEEEEEEEEDMAGVSVRTGVRLTSFRREVEVGGG
jgi:hypothetical protein